LARRQSGRGPARGRRQRPARRLVDDGEAREGEARPEGHRDAHRHRSGAAGGIDALRCPRRGDVDTRHGDVDARLVIAEGRQRPEKLLPVALGTPLQPDGARRRLVLQLLEVGELLQPLAEILGIAAKVDGDVIGHGVGNREGRALLLLLRTEEAREEAGPVVGLRLGRHEDERQRGADSEPAAPWRATHAALLFLWHLTTQYTSAARAVSFRLPRLRYIRR